MWYYQLFSQDWICCVKLNIIQKEGLDFSEHLANKKPQMSGLRNSIQWLRALAVLPEYYSFCPTSQVKWLPGQVAHFSLGGGVVQHSFLVSVNTCTHMAYTTQTLKCHWELLIPNNCHIHAISLLFIANLKCLLTIICNSCFTQHS